jgi:hypothetical protein
MARKGMGYGTGKGYKNIAGSDPKIHSQSASGIKQPQQINVIPNMRVAGWGQIDNSKDSTKDWITAEFSTKTKDVSDSKSILVYDDNEAGYGWRVWIGATEGTDKGTYHSFPSKEKALKFAKDYMYDYERAEFHQKMSDKIERANLRMQKRREKLGIHK